MPASVQAALIAARVPAGGSAFGLVSVEAHLRQACAPPGGVHLPNR